MMEEEQQGGVKEKPALSRFERRERAVLDALRTLVRDYLSHQYGAESMKGQEVDLILRLTTKLDDEFPVSFDPPLVGQLSDQTGGIASEWGVYSEGHLYCYNCKSAQCPHSRPYDPLMVFKGYSNNGTPEWYQFSQALLDARDERVDQLYVRNSKPITRYVSGKELKKDQLSSFGKASRTYSVLAQVIVGYVQLPHAENGSDRRLALTFQVIETRDAGGAFSLRLNAVGRIPTESLQDLYASNWAGWIQRAHRHAEESLARVEAIALSTMGTGEHDKRDRAMKRIPGILRELSDSIERGGRQAGRRTNHVETRREQKRPVGMAMKDLCKADESHHLFDEKTSTIVIEGEQSRYHVFTPEGKHVTSFFGKPGYTEFRVKTRRWRPLEQNEFEVFKKTLSTL